MTNEQAIAIIRKEYLCVDRDCDIERSCGECDLMMPDKEPILEAYKMAINAIEHEQALGEAFNIALLYGKEKGMEAIDKALYQMGKDGIKEQDIKASDRTCHTCKHYLSGERDGSCGSYICKGYSNWESEE